MGTIKDMNENKGFRKRYLKTRPVCKVTFRLPREAAPGARKVTIVGDFSDWDKESNPMKRLKNGSFTVTIELKKGSDYRFRYLVDDDQWVNDWCADRYVQNPYGGDDSVVTV
jgi:1,4-alpha-glucan branching enzyme